MNKTTQIPKEHKRSIDKVINYILKNINGNLSLEHLSDIASYSPFHFQKLFKQVIGESPKQYVIKLRLETAIHSLLIHPHKSIFEVAEDCGFSSPSIFSRSFKKHFNISAEEVRILPLNKLQFLHEKMQFKFNHDLKPERKKNKIKEEEIFIEVKKLNAIKGIHLIAPFGDVQKIQHSFKDTLTLAESNDLLIDDSVICGILNPHQGYVYKTVIAINKTQQVPSKLFVTEIKSGKYATIKVKGDFKNTIAAGKYFFHEWLPNNGYRATGTLVFELFLQSPIKREYSDTEREVCFPIEPL